LGYGESATKGDWVDPLNSSSGYIFVEPNFI